MDTEYLTPMAYECIRLADEATDVLKSEIGAACSQYRDEDAYLQGILADVKEIEENPADYLDWWNLLEQTDMPKFKKRSACCAITSRKQSRPPSQNAVSQSSRCNGGALAADSTR